MRVPILAHDSATSAGRCRAPRRRVRWLVPGTIRLRHPATSPCGWFRRVRRRREPQVQIFESGGIVTAPGLENGVAGDAERAQAVQDRYLEPRLSRHGRNRVEGIEIARQTVDERGLRERGQIAHRIGIAIGWGMDGLAPPGRPAEAAVTPGDDRRGQRAQEISGRLVPEFALAMDECALVGTLIDDFADPHAALTVAAAGRTPCRRNPCSPCRTRTQSTPVQDSLSQNPWPPKPWPWWAAPTCSPRTRTAAGPRPADHDPDRHQARRAPCQRSYRSVRVLRTRGSSVRRNSGPRGSPSEPVDGPPRRMPAEDTGGMVHRIPVRRQGGHDVCRASRTGGPRGDVYGPLPPSALWIFAQVSRSPIVRLKTRLSSVESGSTQK